MRGPGRSRFASRFDRWRLKLPQLSLPAPGLSCGCAGTRREIVRTRSPSDSGVATFLRDARSGRRAAERSDSVVAGRQDVEDSVHADEFEYASHGLGHGAQLQVAALRVQLAKARNECAEAGAVDESHA